MIEICVGAAFHNLSSDIPILIDGVGLTSNTFNRIHPVVLYQFNIIIVIIIVKIEDCGTKS